MQSFTCPLCKINASSQENLEAHFRGKKHKKTMAKMGIKGMDVKPLEQIKPSQVDLKSEKKLSISNPTMIENASKFQSIKAIQTDMTDKQCRIWRQIAYYFTEENLFRDEYLLDKMDRAGWVLLEEIASFKKLRKITKNIEEIILAVRKEPLRRLEISRDCRFIRRSPTNLTFGAPITLASLDIKNCSFVERHENILCIDAGFAYAFADRDSVYIPVVAPDNEIVMCPWPFSEDCDVRVKYEDGSMGTFPWENVCCFKPDRKVPLQKPENLDLVPRQLSLDEEKLFEEVNSSKSVSQRIKLLERALEVESSTQEGKAEILDLKYDQRILFALANEEFEAKLYKKAIQHVSILIDSCMLPSHKEFDAHLLLGKSIVRSGGDVKDARRSLSRALSKAPTEMAQLIKNEISNIDSKADRAKKIESFESRAKSKSTKKENKDNGDDMNILATSSYNEWDKEQVEELDNSDNIDECGKDWLEVDIEVSHPHALDYEDTTFDICCEGKAVTASDIKHVTLFRSSCISHFEKPQPMQISTKIGDGEVTLISDVLSLTSLQHFKDSENKWVIPAFEIPAFWIEGGNLRKLTICGIVSPVGLPKEHANLLLHAMKECRHKAVLRELKLLKAEHKISIKLSEVQEIAKYNLVSWVDLITLLVKKKIVSSQRQAISRFFKSGVGCI